MPPPAPVAYRTVVGIPPAPHRIIQATRLTNPHYTSIMIIYCLTQ